MNWWENVKSPSWILNPFWIFFFFTEKGAWYNNFKMGLHIELGWEMAVWESKEKNSGWWRHLHLICHFEVLKKKYFYYFFVKERSFQIQNLTKQWKMYAWRSSWFSPPFCFFFFAPIYFFCYFLWFKLPKYIIRFTLNSIASGKVFSYNCSPIIGTQISSKKTCYKFYE
jgi:hypothetical protein